MRKSVCLSLLLLIQPTMSLMFAQGKPNAGDIIYGVVSDDNGPVASVKVKAVWCHNPSLITMALSHSSSSIRMTGYLSATRDI